MFLRVPKTIIREGGTSQYKSLKSKLTFLNYDKCKRKNNWGDKRKN